MTKLERRCRRESQQKYRKLGPSPETILENTQVVLCVQIGLISEDEGAKALRESIHLFRQIRSGVIAQARDVFGSLVRDEYGDD